MKIFELFSVFGFSEDLTAGDIPDNACVKNGEIVSCIQPRGTAGLESSPSSTIMADRQYVDLGEMAKKYWRKNDIGREWDERKFWGYGCHCFMDGDGPLSEMGYGIPVDGLDAACRAWKDCQMCVRKKHGENCEFKKYMWKYNGDIDNFAILNQPGTCERELGECDVKFVQDTFKNQHEYDEKNNYFYGGFDRNDRQENCPLEDGPVIVHECCGGYDTPWYWMGTFKNQCCRNPDASEVQFVAPAGSTCNFSNV